MVGGVRGWACARRDLWFEVLATGSSMLPNSLMQMWGRWGKKRGIAERFLAVKDQN